MIRIYKYEIGDEPGSYSVSIKRNCKILKYGAQKETIVFWALVDVEESYEPFRFTLEFTGAELTQEFLEYDKYQDTVQTECGLVYHIFKSIYPE